MTVVATGVGSMPGQDFAESMRVVLGEVGDLPYLVELPDRGVPAAMIGRSLALVTDLGVDLQPAGWRLTSASSIDHRRAISMLKQDLDTLEELAQAHRGGFKVQLVGPWTLAAVVERPRGDRVLGDYGARRDLAQALAEGLARHVDDVRRRLPDIDHLVVQIDEPSLPAVLGGGIPTASGFHRHRSVTGADAAQALSWVVDSAHGSGATAVVHCCAAPLPVAVLRETPVDAVSFDLDSVTATEHAGLAAWVEADRQLWPGVVPSLRAGPEPNDAALTRRLLRWWADLGFADVERLPDFVVTPRCGLAGADFSWARTALGLAANVARNVSVEQGKMEP